MVESFRNRLRNNLREYVRRNRFGLAGLAFKRSSISNLRRSSVEFERLDLLGRYGKPRERDLDAEFLRECLHIFSKRQKQVRAARIVIADVQHLSGSTVLSKVSGKAM